MEVNETVDRPRGWLAAAAAFAVTGALIPTFTATPLGWVGAVLGLLAAMLLPGIALPLRWQSALRLLRCLWALSAMAVSLWLCARALTTYTYQGWDAWVPALLILLVAWRGGSLARRQLDRLGKLLIWALGAMSLGLLITTLPQIQWHNLAVTGWKDAWGCLWAFLITAGAASALIPTGGRLPGLFATGAAGGAALATVGAEGAALARMLPYPFLALCDAAVFGLRLGPIGAAVWALGECALLIHLLSWFPEGRWLRPLACAGALGLTFTMPWGEFALLVLLIAGAVLGYLPVFWGMVHRLRTGETYI